MSRPGVRSPWIRLRQWLLGPVSDPHTHLGSSARIAGFIALAVLCRYVLAHTDPNPYTVGELVTLIVACFGLRARSTQASALTMPMPREESREDETANPGMP